MRPPPPSWQREERIAIAAASGSKVAHQTRERGAARRAATDVERAGLVEAAARGDQHIPVERAKKRPHGHGTDIDTAPAQLDRTIPELFQPAELFLASRAEMDLGDRDREAVSLPCFLENASRIGGTVEACSNGFSVSVGEAIDGDATLPVCVWLHDVVKIAVAAGVVVHTDEVWCAWVVGNPRQLVLADSGVEEPLVKRVGRHDSSTQ
jgi:hypothetical protein